MAVLNPKQHALVVARCGQPAIEVGRPGVGVMGAGKITRVVAVSIEGVFDDVVALHADGVNEELTGEFLKPEPGADLRAVDGDAARRVGKVEIPLANGRSGCVDQT